MLARTMPKRKQHDTLFALKLYDNDFTYHTKGCYRAKQN